MIINAVIRNTIVCIFYVHKSIQYSPKETRGITELTGNTHYIFSLSVNVADENSFIGLSLE